eukprot:TRINITY_DN4133_c0_g1_i2.p2 TRINITY_DN4133_c0_g1~~TRINITY_DN4133_c0_g1_i2.p2  ORF type:complete len:67 (+),score=6.94 TRINITY_DN4133_c0_g1_i2:238-438(+)
MFVCLAISKKCFNVLKMHQKNVLRSLQIIENGMRPLKLPNICICGLKCLEIAFSTFQVTEIYFVGI